MATAQTICGISEMRSVSQRMGPTWGDGEDGGDGGLDEYKRYYGPIDPQGLGTCDPQLNDSQTPKIVQKAPPPPPPVNVAFYQEKNAERVNIMGIECSGGSQGKRSKSSGIPRPLPKNRAPDPMSPKSLLPQTSPPFPSLFWKKRCSKKSKDAVGPLYENILPLGKRGGATDSARSREGRRGHHLPLPVPVNISSPTYTPPSPSLPYTLTTSSSSTSTSSSSSVSSSRSTSPSTSSSSSQSSRDRENEAESTEESSLLLGRNRKRSFASSRSSVHIPPPPIPPRKPSQQREGVRDSEREKNRSQLAQLQKWWAGWDERDRYRSGAEGDRRERKELKKSWNEKEMEKTKKKSRKRKKREERERERERKRRKVKKKKKAIKTKKTKKVFADKYSEPNEGDTEVEKKAKGKGKRDIFRNYSFYSEQYSFEGKDTEGNRGSLWEGEKDGRKREGDQAEVNDRREEECRTSRSRDRRPKSSHPYFNSRLPESVNRYPDLGKIPASVKFWISGGGSRNPSTDAFSSRSRGREKRPLLLRSERGRTHSKEGLCFHEWDSEDHDEGDENEREREREKQKIRSGGRGAVSESEKDRGREVESYSDEGSSGEFGKFEKSWEGGVERGGVVVGDGGCLFGSYSGEKITPGKGQGWGAEEDSRGFVGDMSLVESAGMEKEEWHSPPAFPLPPGRYWSVEKLPIKGKKKLKGGGKGHPSVQDSRGYMACSCQCPHSVTPRDSKKERSSSRSQEELLPLCHSFNVSQPLPLKPNPDQPKSDSQSNLSNKGQLTDRIPNPCLPQPLIPSLPPLPLPSSCSSNIPIHNPPSTSSPCVPPPSVVPTISEASQSSIMATASAKLQYQRLRSVPQPQRFYSPHLPLKAKSLCSRRGSAHFSSLESEV